VKLHAFPEFEHPPVCFGRRFPAFGEFGRQMAIAVDLCKLVSQRVLKSVHVIAGHDRWIERVGRRTLAHGRLQKTASLRCLRLRHRRQKVGGQRQDCRSAGPLKKLTSTDGIVNVA